MSDDLETRYDELYDKAVSRLLDKTDMDICEWLTEDEREEFYSIQKKLFGY